MISRSAIKKAWLALLICYGFAFIWACSGNEGEQLTPDGAKRFLKLRGYDFDEKSFLAAAAASDLIAVNGFLVARIDPNVKDDNGDTALTAAAGRGDLKIVQALTQGGADVNAKGRYGWTACLLALDGDRNQVTDFMLTQPNLDLKAETPNRMSALMLSVWHQRDDVVRKLLQRGADVNHQDEDGDTAVHGGAFYANAKILQMLLDGKANPNIKNKLGGTALMWAASYGHEEIVRMLLDRGADPRIRDVDGVTAAGWAARNGQGNLVMLLKEAEKNRQ